VKVFLAVGLIFIFRSENEDKINLLSTNLASKSDEIVNLNDKMSEMIKSQTVILICINMIFKNAM
jgi:hypothetical protein